MTAQRYPGAVWVPGPQPKAGYFWPLGYSAPKRGEVKHSAEGYWSGLHSVLYALNRRSSWQFTIGYDRVEQHYDVDVNCWHGGDIGDDGGVRANIDSVGIEHLGVAGQPLSRYQVDETTKLTRWLMETRGFTTAQGGPGPGWRLDEHNEVSDTYTACPSGRIPWAEIMRRLEEEESVEPFLVLETGSPNTWLIGFTKPILLGSAAEIASLGAALGPAKIAVSKPTIDQMANT